jgi:hypothetical protein
MLNILKVLLIGIFLVVTLSSAYSNETGNMEKGRKSGADKKRVAPRTKRLLSAFLFLNLVSPQGKAVPRNAFSLTDTDQALSDRIKRRAAENIYKKYGFNNEV